METGPNEMYMCARVYLQAVWEGHTLDYLFIQPLALPVHLTYRPPLLFDLVFPRGLLISRGEAYLEVERFLINLVHGHLAPLS